MSRPPRFLYFDLGNVLLGFDHRRAARQMAGVAGLPVERVWDVVFAQDLEWRYESGQLSSRQFYDEFCARTGSRPDFERLREAGSAIFWLQLPVVPIVTQLGAAGYRLGILSNTSHAHWSYIGQRYRIVRELFSVAALSFELRAMKPEPAIYAAAAELAGVPPEAVFFVDDRPENVDGARRAGLDAIQFTTAAALAEALRRRGVQFNY